MDFFLIAHYRLQAVAPRRPVALCCSWISVTEYTLDSSLTLALVRDCHFVQALAAPLLSGSSCATLGRLSCCDKATRSHSIYCAKAARGCHSTFQGHVTAMHHIATLPADIVVKIVYNRAIMHDHE